MSDWTQLLLYIPGILVFLVGSGRVRSWLRTKRAGSCVDASVYSCRHIVKKDNKGRETFNFYDVTVEYVNPDTGKAERRAVKSPTEYNVSQQVRLYREKGSVELKLADREEESLFHPWVTMIGGAVLIVLALEQNRGNMMHVLACLGVLALMTGINLVLRFIGFKRRGLIEVKSTITETYTRQLTKRSRFLKSDTFTHYPIVKYEINGRENTRLCNVNATGAKSFKAGDHITLYYDPATHMITEHTAGIASLISGILLTALGLLIAGSLISISI